MLPRTLFFMDISIITVTYNNEKHIAAQMRSVVSAIKQITWEQIIVDNNSKDLTVDVIKETIQEKNWPITIVKNNENLGFVAANNLAAAHAQGRFILFLNPDMEITHGTLDELVAYMDAHADVGIAGAQLTDAAGLPNNAAFPRRFPKTKDMAALLLKLPHLFSRILDNYLMAGFEPEKEQDVDSVRGSFLLLRRHFLDVHGWAFDPRYKEWFEDVDLCREVKKKGWRVVHTPFLRCIDLVGQSFGTRPHVKNQARFTKSMLVYVKKWEPWYAWFLLIVLRPVGIALAWTADVFRIGAKKNSVKN